VDTWQLHTLWHQARLAKERLLGDSRAQKHPITLLGKGTKLVGGTIKTQLTAEDIRGALLDGFFPAVASTDYPWVDLAERDNTSGYPMKALSIATTRSVGKGDVPKAWQAAQTITVDQGLELMTRAGAWSTFEEDRKGSITAGKLADLVVLDADPRRVALDDLADVKVRMTLVGGNIEYCSPDAGTLCPTDR